MLACQKNKFSLPEGLHYLNCAYMSPLLKSVEEAGIRALQLKRNPAQIEASDFFTTCNELRSEFAGLIGAEEASQIAIMPSASYGLANAANNIPLGSHDEIILTGEQFPSNVYVWQEKARETGARLRIIQAPEEGESRGKRWNEKILESINQSTKVVAIGHVHWTDGTMFDLVSLSKRIKEVGGYLVVDGTQSVGALPFDVGQIKPDVLVCAAYKWLLGNYGIGLAYYNERFNQGTPIEYNWITRSQSEDFTGLVNYQEEFQPGAQRYDAGERSNFIATASQLEALRQINHWKPEEIQLYAEHLISKPLEDLKDNGFHLEEPQWRSNHLFGIRFSGQVDPRKVAILLEQHNVKVSVRGSAVRVAVNVYNTEEDMEQLVTCLKGAYSL